MSSVKRGWGPHNNSNMIAFMAAALDEGAGPRELGVVGMTMESVKALLVSVYGLGPLSSE